jgi:hypothetical protein
MEVLINPRMPRHVLRAFRPAQLCLARPQFYTRCFFPASWARHPNASMSNLLHEVIRVPPCASLTTDLEAPASIEARYLGG